MLPAWPLLTRSVSGDRPVSPSLVRNRSGGGRCRFEAVEKPQRDLVQGTGHRGFLQCRECHPQIAVPREISVTGFDDLEMSAVVTPGLTTMHFPTAELGTYAAQHLLARIAGKPFEARVELPVELVVRASTAPPLIPHSSLIAQA